METNDAEADAVLDPADAEVGELHEDGSSSLSEPDDDNDESDDPNGADEDMVDGEELAARQLSEVDSEADCHHVGDVLTTAVGSECPLS